MITLKLTQKQTDLIIHSLGSEAIRLNDDTFMEVRNNLLEQLKISNKKRKSYKLKQPLIYKSEHIGFITGKSDISGMVEFEGENVDPVNLRPVNPSLNIDGKYQCCSCEHFFDNPDDGSCPHCGSGSYVVGCIDEPETFTPGEWRRDPDARPFDIYTTTEKGITIIATTETKHQFHIGTEQAERNAALITEAPAMYLRLKRLEDVVSGIEAAFDNGNWPSDYEIAEMRAAWNDARTVLNRIDK